MKGLVILVVVALAVAGSLWFLLGETDVDLRRVEDDIQARLDECHGCLVDTSRVLSGLRAIQPTKSVLTLERALEQIKAAAEARRHELDTLRATRPEAGAPRGSFLESRKAVRSQVEGLLASARQLQRRVELIDTFLRETELPLRLMLENKRQLFLLREQLRQADVPLEDALVVKLDQLAQEAENVRTTASQVSAAAAEDLAQAEILATTATSEVERVLGEQQATIQRLNELATQ